MINMYLQIPFESEIDFRSNISEITKMSLEHDYNINDNMVLGNFYVSGEYKAHTISINKEPFKYTLPFTVELRDDINPETLEFNIEDFSYDVIDNKKLKVNIEYSLKADLKEKEELFERVDENSLNEEITYIDSFMEKENENKKEEENEEKGETINENSEEIRETEERNEEVEIEEKTILDNIKESDETFVTYHIHIVKQDETIESIAKLYNTPVSIINDYNEVDSMNIGDKIIIPKLDE